MDETEHVVWTFTWTCPPTGYSLSLPRPAHCQGPGHLLLTRSWLSSWVGRGRHVIPLPQLTAGSQVQVVYMYTHIHIIAPSPTAPITQRS